MKRNTLFVTMGLIGLAGFAATAVGAGNDGHSPKTPLAHAIGPAKNCIPITSIRDSEVQDDWTIDFHMGGRDVYRVTLPQRCNGLGTYRSFKYETSLSELCNTDIITVMEYGGPGGGPRGSCGMGMFTPVEIAK
ncbi:hypothetical protein [Novosphingobium sp.]|uniref:hypothetical protein n=1 Tax=Novosphingobium sp. TaxID=1874826 RepID=UPI003B515F4E